jgi:hypothetical protein
VFIYEWIFVTDQGKVVTAQDITQFFLQKEEERYVKRQKRS